jgi:hypothetical protein
MKNIQSSLEFFENNTENQAQFTDATVQISAHLRKSLLKCHFIL